MMRKPLITLGATVLALTAALVTSAPAASRPSVARLTDFLQKSFLISNRDNIHFEQCRTSSLPGMWQCSFKIAVGRGQQPMTLLTDSKTRAVVFGSAVPLRGDLWPRRDLHALKLHDRPTLGDPDAPITIIEFGDFECPFCARAAAPLEQAVNDHDGEVKLIFKYLPLRSIHPWAEKGALFSECARRQRPAAFWSVTDTLYQQQREISVDNFDSHLQQIADQQQLDRRQLDACMASADAKARIDEDVADAQALKISSTPNVFVQGIHVGGPDHDKLEFVIDDQLREHTMASRR